MVTQAQFKAHYENLYKSGAIYLWGANGETITKELCDKLFKTFGSASYPKSYFNNKYIEGKGKIGADCSGSIYPLSKADNSAKGYYNACPANQKGSINNLPKNTACLVFNAGFTHVGAYLGNGITIEMANSKKNCVKENFNKTRWAYYGIPAWLENPENKSNTPIKEQSSTTTVVTPAYDKKQIVKNIQKWCNDYCNAGLVANGSFDTKTKKSLCKALQHYLNVTYKAKLVEDGSFGAKTKAACVSCSGKNALSYICQAMLFYKGYDMTHSITNNNLDGSYGKGTKATVLLYQQETKGLRHDGDCGAATFYSLFNN